MEWILLTVIQRVQLIVPLNCLVRLNDPFIIPLRRRKRPLSSGSAKRARSRSLSADRLPRKGPSSGTKNPSAWSSGIVNWLRGSLQDHESITQNYFQAGGKVTRYIQAHNMLYLKHYVKVERKHKSASQPVRRDVTVSQSVNHTTSPVTESELSSVPFRWQKKNIVQRELGNKAIVPVFVREGLHV